jgi:hypothetical protein
MGDAKSHTFVRFAAVPASAAALLVIGLVAGCEEGAGQGAAQSPAQTTPADADDNGEYQPQSTLGKAHKTAEDTVEMAEEYNDKLMKQIEEGIDAEDD